MGYVAAAMAVIGAITNVTGAAKARGDARDAADQEAHLEGLVTDAKVKGLESEQRVLRGQTIAGAAGSGVLATVGSPLQILAEQVRNFADEIRVTKQAGATRAANAQTRGRMVGNTAMYQGISNATTGLANAFGYFQQAQGA